MAPRGGPAHGRQQAPGARAAACGAGGGEAAARRRAGGWERAGGAGRSRRQHARGDQAHHGGARPPRPAALGAMPAPPRTPRRRARRGRRLNTGGAAARAQTERVFAEASLALEPSAPLYALARAREGGAAAGGAARGAAPFARFAALPRASLVVHTVQHLAEALEQLRPSFVVVSNLNPTAPRPPECPNHARDTDFGLVCARGAGSSDGPDSVGAGPRDRRDARAGGVPRAAPRRAAAGVPPHVRRVRGGAALPLRGACPPPPLPTVPPTAFPTVASRCLPAHIQRLQRASNGSNGPVGALARIQWLQRSVPRQ